MVLQLDGKDPDHPILAAIGLEVWELEDSKRFKSRFRKRNPGLFEDFALRRLEGRLVALELAAQAVPLARMPAVARVGELVDHEHASLPTQINQDGRDRLAFTGLKSAASLRYRGHCTSR